MELDEVINSLNPAAPANLHLHSLPKPQPLAPGQAVYKLPKSNYGKVAMRNYKEQIKNQKISSVYNSS